MTTLWEKADVNLDGVLSKKEVVTLLQSMNVKSDTRYSRALILIGLEAFTEFGYGL